MKIINKHTLRIAGYTAAIFMFSLLGCKKIDYFLGRYHVSVDAQIQHGSVLFSANGTLWHEMHAGDDTVVQEGKYWFKVNCEPDYQFNGWKQTDIPFPNEIPIQVTINNNVVVFPDITISKKEHIITLKSFRTEPLGMSLPEGTVEYAINGGGWLNFAANQSITLQQAETINIRVMDDSPTPAPNPIHFWGWLDIPGVSPIKRETGPMTLTQDISFSAEFRNYPPVKVAIVPVINPASTPAIGKIQWSTTENGIYTDLKTADPYDSIFKTQSVFVRAVINNPYYKVAATPLTISGVSSTITSISGDIYKATIDEFAFDIITANFLKIKYTLTTATLPTGIQSIQYSTDGANYTAIPAGEVSLDAGSDIYFKTIVDNGYDFGEWTGDIAGPTYLNAANLTKNPTGKLVVKSNIIANAKVLTQAIVTIKGNLTGGQLSYMLDNGTEMPVTTADVPVIVPTGKTLVVKATSNAIATPYYRFDKFNITGTGAPALTPTMATNTATLSAYTGKLGDAFTIDASFVKQLKIDVPTLASITGANAFSIAPNTSYATTAGYQPTTNTPVTATATVNTIYIDDQTTFTATATPITTDPNYYRFGNWNGGLAGTLKAQANTSNAYKPLTDMSVPAPTFVRQWKLTLDPLTEGFFNTNATKFTTTAGDQPVAGTLATWLSSNTARLVGYFDDNTSIDIGTTPATNKKIRFSLNGSPDSKITSFTITQNSTLKGTSSDLRYDDLFDYGQTITATSSGATGNDYYFSQVYATPDGLSIEGSLSSYGKLVFTINALDQLTSVSITNTSTGSYSGFTDDFGVTATNYITPTIVANRYTYTLTTTAAVGYTPAGASITLTLTLIGNGNGRMDITLTGSDSNDGTISFPSVFSVKP